jgi:hypothetical protein
MMPLAMWLKLRFVRSLLAKLVGWTWEDLAAFAMQTHGRFELSRAEVVALCALLKHAGLSKPAACHYQQLPASGPCPPGDLVFRRNVARPCNETCYHAGDRGLQLRFASQDEHLAWVGQLLDSDGRASWHTLLRREQARLRYSAQPETSHPLTPAAAQRQARTQRRLAAERLPLPDNATLEKRYWGLEPGDRLVHPQRPALVVTQVRLNAGQPPTLTLEEAPAP